MDWKTRCSVLYCGLFIFQAMIINNLGTYIPYLSSYSGLEESAYAPIFLWRGVGFMVGNLTCGYLCKRQDSHHLLALSCAIQTVGSMFVFSVLSPGWLGLGFMSMQFGAAWIFLLCQTCLLEVHGRQMEWWLQMLHFSYGVGSILAPYFVILLERRLFVGLSVTAVVFAVLLLRLDSPKAAEEVTLEKRMGLGNFELFMIGCWFVCYMGVEVGYGGWIPTFAVVRAGFTKEAAGLCASVYWLFLTGGRLIAVFVADRYEPEFKQDVLIVACVATALLNCLVYLLGYAALCTTVGVAFFGLTLSAMYPLTITCLTLRGYRLGVSELSLFVMMAAVGESVIPWLIGLAMQSQGEGSMLSAELVSAMALAGIYFYLFKMRLEHAK